MDWYWDFLGADFGAYLGSLLSIFGSWTLLFLAYKFLNKKKRFYLDIHHWFELSYSSYLVLPRSLMEGMPIKWQHKMIDLLEEMREVYDSNKIKDNYVVQLRDGNGRFTKDPLANYRHPGELPYREIPKYGNEASELIRKEVCKANSTEKAKKEIEKLKKSLRREND